MPCHVVIVFLKVTEVVEILKKCYVIESVVVVCLNVFKYWKLLFAERLNLLNDCELNLHWINRACKIKNRVINGVISDWLHQKRCVEFNVEASFSICLRNDTIDESKCSRRCFLNQCVKNQNCKPHLIWI